MTDHCQNKDFWDLSEFSKKNQRTPNTTLSFATHRTSAVEIIAENTKADNDEKINPADTMITKFIPPHSDANFAKKNVLFEYEPHNPLIKKVTVFSDKADETLFVSDNLFIRERRALLDRTTTFKEPVPFYSYSPRYSQLNKSQLNWYIWWRQNARNGNYIKTDESYILLYAYELASTSDSEDKEAALDMLCSLITQFDACELGIIYKIMIRDIICDFCLIHRLSPPVKKLAGIERQVLFGSFLPEFFIDFSQNNEHCATLISSMSLYDYRRSKCYNETNADIYQNGINGAINAVVNNADAFNSITSFTRGVYSSVTEERHPFNRMANIVNKNIKIEIAYFELGNLKSAVTDIVRYSENKIREHLGIRNKIHVLTINPHARIAIDSFFENNLPAHQFVDRRRKSTRISEDEPHDYDKLYDLPKTDISPERALEIERESWATTKKLTEAFTDSDPIEKNSTEPIIAAVTVEPKPKMTAPTPILGSNELYIQLSEQLGAISQFIDLCKGSGCAEQKKFASTYNITVDELADKINEAAVELFGDIILENNGDAYSIIDEYLFLFD